MAYSSDIYNFRAVKTSLTTSGQPTEEQLRALAEEGYEVIINLALHDDPRYSLEDETGLVESLGMEYIHIPVQFDAPTEDDLLKFSDAMDANREKMIHIHCAANMRVSTFLGLYHAIRKERSIEEAFTPMQSVWEPDEVWSAFISEMLEKYAD
ncbi:MAG: protein tyrosine phosphatase family protein [Gammaproteobacteria bacterium]